MYLSQMFQSVGYSNDNLELDLNTLRFTSKTNYQDIFNGLKASQKIWVYNTSNLNWVINAGNSNLTTNNVFIKSYFLNNSFMSITLIKFIYLLLQILVCILKVIKKY